MKHLTKQRALFLIMGLLLFTRLVFFLKDRTNDTIELMLFIIIFILSLITLALIFKSFFYNIFYKKHYKRKALFFIYLVLLDLLFQLNNNISVSFIYPFALFFGVGIIVIISISLPAMASKIYDLAVSLFALLYVLGQDIYRQIFEGVFLLRDFATAQEGADFAMGVYTFSVFHLLYVLTFIAFIVSYYKLSSTEIKDRGYVLWRLSKAIFLIFLLLNLNAVYPVKSARLHTSDHYLIYSNFSPLKVSSRFGVANLFFRDSLSLFSISNTYEDEVEQVNNYLNTYSKNHLENEYTGLFEDKNIVFIVGESYDEIALSEELTPNLYRLKTEGLDFSNHYTPVYPRTTCDTEIIINTGLIPSINDGPTCYEFNQNSYRNSLANLFKKANYDTTALHSNYEEFYTREIVYPNLGYNQFLGQNLLQLSDSDIRYDSIFMKESLPYVSQTDNPFFTFMVTLSGHSPYSNINLAAKEHYDIVNQYYGDRIPESVKYYIATQIEADYMIEELIQYLEETNQLHDTVIIFTNDHYPYTLNNQDFELVKGTTNLHKKQKGALYIWNPSIDQKTITTLSSTFDIVPTMINLFNLQGDYTEYIGNDIFDNTTNRFVYFKDYVVRYDSRFIDLSNNTSVDDQTYQYLQDTYAYSINVLQSNYYKNE